MNEDMIFSNCGSIVIVIDAQDEPYTEALARLHDIILRAHRYNPEIFFEVFIHKVDGDLYISDDHKIGTQACLVRHFASIHRMIVIDCQREIQHQIMEEINDTELDIHMSFYLTRFVQNLRLFPDSRLVSVSMITVFLKPSAKSFKS